MPPFLIAILKALFIKKVTEVAEEKIEEVIDDLMEDDKEKEKEDA